MRESGNSQLGGTGWLLPQGQGSHPATIELGITVLPHRVWVLHIILILRPMPEVEPDWAGWAWETRECTPIPVLLTACEQATIYIVGQMLSWRTKY